MPKIPGDSPTSAATFPPRTPYVFTGRTIRVESEEELAKVPKGAVRLSRKDVIKAADRFKQRKEFRAFRKLEEWWPIASGLSCAWTSIYVISIVRHKFKLGRYHARAIHYVSGSVFPTIFVPFASIPVVTEPAMLKEYSCSDCLAFRSGLVQVAGGMVWSSAIAILGALYYAKRYHTVPLPPVSPRFWREYGKIFSQPFKPALPFLFAHSLLQFFVGYVGGIKFWYLGQEMNAVDNYLAMKTHNYESGTSHPQLVLTKVEADWLTEMIATGNIFGKAVAKDDEDEEEDIRYVNNIRYIIDKCSNFFFGG